jgi:hypothetical protein
MTITHRWPARRLGVAARSSPGVRVLVGIVGTALLAFGCAQSTSGAGGGPPVTVLASQSPSQPVLDRKVLADFRRDVDKYITLHDKLQRQGTAPKQRADIGENLVSRNALATRIRLARHDAEQGDILTPAIAVTIRTAMNPTLRGPTGSAARESIRDDAPAIFVLEVNGDYPDGESRPTMPGNLLQILPPLPPGLEYRIVDTHLVLMDVDANIVVDYLLDVMCASC